MGKIEKTVNLRTPDNRLQQFYRKIDDTVMLAGSKAYTQALSFYKSIMSKKLDEHFPKMLFVPASIVFNAKTLDEKAKTLDGEPKTFDEKVKTLDGEPKTLDVLPFWHY
jgi:hypothetical protein